MKRVMLEVLVLAVCGIMVGPVGMAGKPEPPTPVEPTDVQLEISDTPQLLVVSDGYARLWDWDSTNKIYVHSWSGSDATKGLIGYVGSDGSKKIIGFSSETTGTRKNTVTKNYIKIWEAGDLGTSPSHKFEWTGGTSYPEIGNTDGDSDNELVVLGSGGVEVWSITGDGISKEASISSVGSGGLTLGDADNDGREEILVGMAANSFSHGVVVDYDTGSGSYSIVGDLGPKDVQCTIDELSVGDLDGTAGNEIFGSGYNGNNIYVWRYADGKYQQVWTTQHPGNYSFDQSNEIADIDGDGDNEIIYTQRDFSELRKPVVTDELAVYEYGGKDNNGKQYWTLVERYPNCPGNQQDAMVSGDLDGDEAAELAISYMIWDWDGEAMVNIQNTTDTSVRISIS
jgi:hypothetical protein